MQTPKRFYRYLMKPKNWMWRIASLFILVGLLSLLPVLLAMIGG